MEKVKLPAGTDLRWFADSLDLTFKDLQELNPELKVGQVPPDRQEYALKVPVAAGRAARRLARLCWQQQKVAALKGAGGKDK